MGFSGGGSNQTLPHTHDGTVSQDGGPLDFGNVTQSQSASGEIFFSDGVHLQQLPIGAPNDQIRVSGANLPEYFTPAAAASTFEELANVSATSGTSITTPVFTPKKYLMIWSFLNVSAGMSFRVGSTTLDTSNSYAQTEMYTDGTTVGTAAQAARSNLECFYQTGGICLVTNNIVNIAAQQKVMDISAKGMATSSTGGIKNFSGLWYNNTNQIDIVGWSGSTITEANIVVWGRD